MTAALLLAASASAQRYSNPAPEGEYSPTVYLISVQETENIGCTPCEAAERNRMTVANATQDYIDTHRPGFQQAERP
ncbi:MAG: porin, partial [Alistipes sp.]|nr:porin [Alistipes sp.]